MSQEHDAIRRIYEAFGRRDLDAISAELHEEALVDFTRSLSPDTRIYPGVEGIKMLLDMYWEAFEEISIEPETFTDCANGIVVTVVARGLGRDSGANVEARGPHLWAFRDGKPIRFTLFQELADALAAAGLSR